MTIAQDRDVQCSANLGPFELKDELIRFAEDNSLHKAATNKSLPAGHGNPNWVATTPREAFFLLGQFALEESQRVWPEPGVGGMPAADGAANRLQGFLARAAASRGAELLATSLAYGTHVLGFRGDAFVHELTDAIIGDNYPEPDRMLFHTERIVHRYLVQEMFGDEPPVSKFDLFAVEGGTAAMCYVFRSLFANGILKPGDTIALGTPSFTPYLEIPKLREYGLNIVEIQQSAVTEDGCHTRTYPSTELEKLGDPRVKVFFTVNPSNLASPAATDDTHARLQTLVHTLRPDLIILTDDVDGTFVPGFRSFADTLPHNTVLVYSFSKYFGCTGWRLGVIAVHQDNVIDRALAEQAPEERARLKHRYGCISSDPSQLRFIDRMVADSRDVALNQTAGLSPPQQVQMALFALFALLDTRNLYKRRCRDVLRERLRRLETGLCCRFPADPLRAGYYVDLDLAAWGRNVAGEEFVDYVASHRTPREIVVALARKHGTVLLNGSAIDGPPWSVRISLANLHGNDYEAIGRDLSELCRGALETWRNERAVG